MKMPKGGIITEPLVKLLITDVECSRLVLVSQVLLSDTKPLNYRIIFVKLKVD